MKFAYLLPFLALASATPVERVSCPPFFTVVGSSCYYFDERELESFDDARQACQTYGGDLAVIDDCEDHDLLQEFLEKAAIAHNTDIYIGLYDEGHQDLWMWVSGSFLPATSVYWNPANPTVSNTNNCGVVSLMNEQAAGMTHTRLRLVDRTCDNKKNFLCETDPGL